MKEYLNGKQDRNVVVAFNTFFWRTALKLDKGFREECVERISVAMLKGEELNKLSRKILGYLPEGDRQRIQSLGKL